MYERQVPKDEWFEFFKGFSRRHAEWTATVRILSPRLGCQVESHDLPLEGIDTGRAGVGPISIHIGREPKKHVEHAVEKPLQVWVEVADDGVEEALDIESEDGTKTLVIFSPETVDDVLRRAQ